ncbi:MAG TPA: DUF4349 domain-containing protein, partial [Tepidisphaeraceae bacterium]|nr:DUF4349 domain-containing protein [Tepidisphaeraceae bacterium]
MPDMESNHILDQIEAYLSDGLTADERLALESHAAGCPICAEALAEARAAHAELDQLFAGVRPRPAFEDQIISRLRQAPSARKPWNPMIIRSALATAAAVALTGTGIVVNQVVQGKPLADVVSGTSHMQTASGLRQIGNALALYNYETTPGRSSAVLSSDQAGKERGEVLRDGANRYTGATNANGGTLLLGVKRNALPEQEVDGRKAEPGLVTKDKLAVNWGESYGFKPAEQLKGNKDESEKNLGEKSNSLYYRSDGETPRGGFGGGSGSGGAASFTINPATGVQGSIGQQTGALGVQPQTPGIMTIEQGKEVKAELRDANGPAPAAPAGAPAAQPELQAHEASPAPLPAETNPTAGRKIIRNGTMEFEVERFDDALIRVTKLTTEQGGFVATTDSDKLPNGKMKGTVTLRVPPEHLDTLILTLRGIGDLKSQKIGAEDVTKHYTDLESQLRAAQAMYDRLLDIIKTGKGQVKDLVEAEKQLGVWTEKIEQLKGEQKYLDNLVSFSTLVLQLYEKDIRTPASVSETEQVSMSLETEKVDEGYNKAIEAIRAAKGRILQSELKQFDAGQLGGTIQAAIPPDAAEQTIARLRQLDGRIAHFSRDRRQTTQAGASAPAEGVKVNREDVVIAMQIYNLANIAPRRTT